MSKIEQMLYPVVWQLLALQIMSANMFSLVRRYYFNLLKDLAILLTLIVYVPINSMGMP